MGFHHGIAGLNAASTSLDVIGHNIANSNTVGFKQSRAEFNEMIASAMGCSGGGNNGIGVTTAAVTQQFTSGNITPTGRGLDMAINGDGFFTVDTGSGVAYTRNGAFQLNRDGYLTTANGDRVQGWNRQDVALTPPAGGAAGAAATTVSMIPTGGTPGDLQFPVGKGMEAKVTETASLIGNLPATARDAAGQVSTPPATDDFEPTPRATFGTTLTVYDSQGVAYQQPLYFEKGADNTWTVFNGLDVAADATATPPVQAWTATNLGTITFDGKGNLNLATNTLEVEVGGNPNPNALPNNPNTPPDPFTVTIDLSGLTQTERGNQTKMTVEKLTQDGNTAGSLTEVNVTADGTLMASYSNGVTRAEGKVALARFTNNQGLEPSGNNNWVATPDAGQVVYGGAGDGSFGAIKSASLESSNVDLTAELVNMMTAQRFYQANAQTIKTQDQVFSTLVNLR